MASRVIIPERTHSEFGDSIAKLIRVVDKLSFIDGNEVELDFSNVKMLNPFFLGGLACLVNYYESKGVKFISNHDGCGIWSYLRTICFPGCYIPALRKDIFDAFLNKSYLPITKFPTGDSSGHELVRDGVLSAISDLLKRQLNFTERERAPLTYFLSELTHNINDHSGAQNGFVFGQFYPSSSYLDLCICDYGKGIYESYLNNPRFNPKNEIEALEFAINGRSTKDRAEARGFGISTSRDMLVNGLGGKFFIWTGNSAYMQSIDKQGILNIPESCHFQGTFVALRIPTVIPKEFNLYNYLE